MTLLKQVGVVGLGLILAAVMIGLGLWQLNVYESQGHDVAVRRAAAPPVDVTSVAAPGHKAGDAYGRTVSFTGHYDPDLQTYLALPDRPGSYRVLTAFRLNSGGALPVVRGVVRGKNAPAPPSRTLTQVGVLLPAEGADPQAEPGSDPTSVALAALAQAWSPELVNGYATLTPAEARAQQLQPADVALPSSHGRLRNGFYALQWWVFAGFAVLMGIRMARDFGREARDQAGDSPSGTHDEVAREPVAVPAGSPGRPGVDDGAARPAPDDAPMSPR